MTNEGHSIMRVATEGKNVKSNLIISDVGQVSLIFDRIFGGHNCNSVKIERDKSSIQYPRNKVTEMNLPCIVHILHYEYRNNSINC